MLIAEGPRVVRELLEAGGRVHHALVAVDRISDPSIAAALDALRVAGIAAEEVPGADFDAVADTMTPQGILVVTDIPVFSLVDVHPPFLLVLDGVQDPGNVGTLIRSAEALGAGGVGCLPGTADPWSPKAVRSAAGSCFRMPVFETSVEDVRAWCRETKAPLLAASADGEPAVRGEARRSAALVLGNEGAGVSPEILDIADGVVAVPHQGSAESLNVAIAGALLMDRMFGG